MSRKKQVEITTPRKPKIIIWDIETLPNLKEVMSEFPGLSNYPGLTFKATINTIICVGWKELGKSKVHCINAWDYKKRWKRDPNDDREVVKAAYDVLKDADVVVTHNGRKFDWKFLQTRLLVHGFHPLPKIIHIDTLAIARKNLLSFNNRLNTLGKFLAHDKKKENGGWPLWVKVLEGDKKALNKMTAYCKQDVRLLEKIFKRLLPLADGLPNFNMFQNSSHACSKCGSFKLIKRGERVSKTQRLQLYQCKACGSWSQETKKGLKP